MKIKSAEFIKSAFSEEHWTTDKKPEIAFMGKSNVGKSSLINSLLNRKSLARTSNTPGRTQSINFFLINESFYFVDLPGYGYAKAPEKIRREWGKMIEDYLAKRDQLVLFIHLVDSRHEPTNQDKQLHDWLLFYQKPHLIVATKADKLSAKKLGLGPSYSFHITYICFPRLLSGQTTCNCGWAQYELNLLSKAPTNRSPNRNPTG